MAGTEDEAGGGLVVSTAKETRASSVVAQATGPWTAGAKVRTIVAMYRETISLSSK